MEKYSEADVRYAKRHEEKRDIEGVNSLKGGHMAEPHVLPHEVSWFNI